MISTMPQRYVSNKNESVRMFESDFMELFSHVHPATPLVIYLPLMGYMLYRRSGAACFAARRRGGPGRGGHPNLELRRVHDAPLGFSL